MERVTHLTKTGAGVGRLFSQEIESVMRDFGLPGTILQAVRVQEERQENWGQTWGVSA